MLGFRMKMLTDEARMIVSSPISFGVLGRSAARSLEILLGSARGHWHPKRFFASFTLASLKPERPHLGCRDVEGTASGVFSDRRHHLHDRPIRRIWPRVKIAKKPAKSCPGTHRTKRPDSASDHNFVVARVRTATVTLRKAYSWLSNATDWSGWR